MNQQHNQESNYAGTAHQMGMQGNSGNAHQRQPALRIEIMEQRIAPAAIRSHGSWGFFGGDAKECCE